MSERIPLFRPTFNRAVRVEARADQVTSDAGLILLRELEEKLEITSWIAGRLVDPRDPSRVQHTLPELFRTRLLTTTMGWTNQDDIKRLSTDPALRVAVSDDRGEAVVDTTELASQPTLSRLMALLSNPTNLELLNEALVVLAGRSLRAQSGGEPVEVVLDIDSIVMEVHGHQDGSAYNGQYGLNAYHPLVAVLGETGDIVGVWLRPGNVHTASQAVEFMEGVIKRVEAEIGPVRAVRLDAGFPSEPLMEALEARGTPYVARIRKNASLAGLADWATLPMLPPPETIRTQFKEMAYQAGSWSIARRTVYVRIDEPGELFSRGFFLVSSIATETLAADELLALYRRRGCAEDAFGQWLGAVTPTLCSTNRKKSTYRGEAPKIEAVPVDPFAVNEANLLMSALASNLLIAFRRLVVTATNTPWRLDRLRDQVLKVGARVIRGGRLITLCVASSATGLWEKIIAEIERFAPVAAIVLTT